MIEGELSTNQQSKITHYLSKKWNLESSVDSDDDGYKDTVDPNPVSGTDSTTLVTTGRIGMPTETITVQLIPTGNDIPTGLTFEITNQPSIGSAQVIADQASNSGYSLQYNPPNNANDYALEKVSINVGIIHSNGTKGASTTIPIYFYQFEINTNGNFFIPPGFARLDQTSIQVNDIIWNFNNIALNNIGNNQDNTIAEEIDNIPNDGNNIGNNSPISVFNLATNSDQLGNYPIHYKIETNNYFDINPNNGEVFIKNTAFSDLDFLQLMVQATATTNEGIEGVYSYINIETGFVDIGFGDGFIGEGGDIDFEKITFNKPVLGEGEKYGVNFSDDQFANFTGPIPIDENFKNKFFDENAEAAFDDLDINLQQM